MNLSSTYAGLELTSPVIVGASPLALDAERLKQLVGHGAGAVVMPSIFEEQISHAESGGTLFAGGDTTATQQYPDLLTFRPQLDAYNGGTEGYLKNIEAAKTAVDAPIIASVNCITTGSWMQYAQRIELAGADALELNLYHYEVDPHRFAEDIERELLDRVSVFCSVTKLPVSVKLLPQFTALANMAYRIAGAGAKGVCLFGQSPRLGVDSKNRKSYRWPLTSNSELRVCLEGIRIVYGAVHNLSIAASGGIQSTEDAIDAIQLGANVVMITSTIYQQGASVVKEICDGVCSHLNECKMSSLSELIGSKSRGFNPYPEAFRRQDYTLAVTEFT
jgi:dihydroorotate dehydrogenase (fumarate)